jgi:hypothetical protein
VASWIFSAISPLLKLWLASQVETIEDLHIEVNSSTSQLLQGIIPQGIVTAKNITYQGLGIASIHLTAEHIHLNVAQMLQGHSLRLLQPIQVKLTATIDRDHLAPALTSPLLVQALGYQPQLPLTDPQIRSILAELLAVLAGEVKIDRLEIDDRGLVCAAQFQIRAT